MRYDTFIPCNRLKPYVSHFAISENPKPQTYKVLPGTGLVIGFQYKGRLTQLKDGKNITLSTSGLTGLHDRYLVFENSADMRSVLVYFKDGGAAAFFKQPIHELFRESISLDNFMLRSELLILEEQLCEANSDAKRIDKLEKFLIVRMLELKPDLLVLNAITLIYKSRGTIKIKELSEQLYISQSPLEKRFRQVVGTSPKKFASIVRFKHALQSFNPKNSLTDLSYETGFYDQAHFIKEFRNFTGDTPEDFFRLG